MERALPRPRVNEEGVIDFEQDEFTARERRVFDDIVRNAQHVIEAAKIIPHLDESIEILAVRNAIVDARNIILNPSEDELEMLEAFVDLVAHQWTTLATAHSAKVHVPDAERCRHIFPHIVSIFSDMVSERFTSQKSRKEIFGHCMDRLYSFRRETSDVRL